MRLKNVLDMLKDKIFGKNRKETLENVLILILLSFSLLLSISIALSALWPKGIIAVLAMVSSFFIFITTILLVLLWLVEVIKFG